MLQGIINYENKEYKVLLKLDNVTELVLFDKSNDEIVSAYKEVESELYAYKSSLARTCYNLINKVMSYYSTKKVTPITLPQGVGSRFEGKRYNTEFDLIKFNKEFYTVKGTNAKYEFNLTYSEQSLPDITSYTHLVTTPTNLDFTSSSSLDEVPIRTLEEIGLDKDITWLNSKKYYVVNKTKDVLKLIRTLREHDGIISYDTETTGVAINMFGQYGSDKYYEMLEVNAKLGASEKYKCDSLVGICLSIREDEGFYIPVQHRKFANVFEDDSELVNSYKQKLSQKEDLHPNIARFISNLNSYEDIPNDILLMEFLRGILEDEERELLAHNCAFDWRVNHLYSIDTRFTQDTMIMHQLIYKFKDGKKEESGLKKLVEKYLGVEQLDLKDFFVHYEEDDSGKRKSTKKSRKGMLIDFSYMDYDGTKAYAPADADLTLQIFNLFNKDFTKNYTQLTYLYHVEVTVAHAVGYMEFYGLKINESKIENARLRSLKDKLILEHKIRAYGNKTSQEEISLIAQLEQCEEPTEEFLLECEQSFSKPINELGEVFNVGSAKQVASYFYYDLDIPCVVENDNKPSQSDTDEEKIKLSVAKAIIKNLAKAINEDGTVKYPILELYQEWKELSTQLSKFYTQLPEFMYPGGYIFASYGQISTNTGRMSCSKPNNQQLPKYVTKLVIPRENCLFLDADFSQIEYRVMVGVSGEKQLSVVFQDPDNDYHTMMASLLFSVPYEAVTGGMRKECKALNFGIPFGMGLQTLCRNLFGAVTDENMVLTKEKYDAFFESQPKVKEMFTRVKADAKNRGFTTTMFNRVRGYIFKDSDGNYSRSLEGKALRQAGNHVIQGCIHGDTLIQTKDFGIVKIKDVANTKQQVWNGTKWTNGDILYSGKKQKCIVTFNTGQKFICSPDHKFLVRSHRGNERFVRCEDLLQRETLNGDLISTSPHRVVTNRQYESSDWKYNSMWAYNYKGTAPNSNNVYLEDIGDSFKIGVMLGRLASDGSIQYRGSAGGNTIRQLIAEHEFNIVDTLKDCMQNLNYTYRENDVREGRNQRINILTVYSKSLTKEIVDLDIKHKIHNNIFRDTELLRGFMCGFFDGDGGFCGENLILTFGIQADFEPICRDIQKALLFLGIRSRFRKHKDRHVIVIVKSDIPRFMETIGFINTEKQAKGEAIEIKRKPKMFDDTLIVDTVEITDEYIDMYDVCNTDEGYYVADGIITHNTAADLFKIAVARTFLYIRRNSLLGSIYISNMVHDEQLLEIDVINLNSQAVLRDIVNCMEVDLSKYDFPPLYVGAGFGDNWYDAKDSPAELHPYLVDILQDEVKDTDIRDVTPTTVEDVLKYYQDRIFNYRFSLIRDYISDPNNYGKPFKSSLGNLLNSQFGYPLDNIGELSSGEVIYKRLEIFVDKYNLDVDLTNFSNLLEADVVTFDLEQEKAEFQEFLNGDDEDLEKSIGGKRLGKKITETGSLGVSKVDIAKEYGYMFSEKDNELIINFDGLDEYLKKEVQTYLKAHSTERGGKNKCQLYIIHNNELNKVQEILYGVSHSNLDLLFNRY